MNNFSIRVYGILINGKQEVLISDEREYGMEFSKFAGGGLEYGEGLLEGLSREFMEECGTNIEILRHIHTTDVFFKSAFSDSQVIGVYYLVRNLAPFVCRFSEKRFDFEAGKEPDQVFRWVPLAELKAADLTFEMDRAAWQVLVSEKSYGLEF
ncbi:NUDIX domain-containing protein [Parapedobacter koreensis]|uniref:ADP-ribose pyrophosphatase YjhB, NUDIX family n=1 Tax=Parapedobacter koreensis TaxID=332977 RepID=A0A1H7M5J5_9SPHI|nr:NUDIX domain-containing protein [Parapedobacter koreensis]SEL05847.1 ADP-ribose pyrophosphatase YjhB, NUDIX family [Parapedobacter koreensis]